MPAPRATAALAALTALALIPAAPAQNWTGTTASGSWNTAGNWYNSQVPNSTTVAVTFGTLSGPFYGVNVTGSVQVQSISFSNTSGNYDLTSGANQKLTVSSITIGSGVTTTD